MPPMSAPPEQPRPGSFPDWPEPRAARRFFERAAATTGTADALAREVESRMLERLPLMKIQPKNILDAGCGLGKGLALLGERYAGAHLFGVDSALAALRAGRGQRAAPLRWLDRALGLVSGRGAQLACADMARLPLAPRCMDMVWSNLALAWPADPPAVFREFHRVLNAGGLLMFASYGPDTLRELRAAFAGVDAHPHTHRFVDMHDLGDMLVEAGFANPVMDMETLTLTYAGFDALARDLRSSGQANAAVGRRRGLLGRGAWQRVRERYPVRDGRLPATFEIVYGHAWRGEPRARPGEPAVVRFEPRRPGR